MRFFTLATAALLPLSGLAASVENCGKGPFVSGSAGKPLSQNRDSDKFCESRWEKGDVITGIRVWWLKFQLKAVQFRYAGDDWGKVLGDNSESGDDQEAETTWGEDESIGLELWNNRPDDGDKMDAVGKIEISQPGEKDVFKAGGSKIAKDSIKVDVGSGRLFAVQGAAGSHISSLTFYFLKSKIKSMEMTEIKLTGQDFGKWAKDTKQGPQVIANDDTWFKNSDTKGGSKREYKVSQSLSESESKTISRENTRTFGFSMSVSIGVSAELPIFGGGVETQFTSGFEHSKSETKAESKTTSKESGVNREVSVEVAPQKAVRCVQNTQRGQYESPYTATITAKLENGDTFKYQNSGDYVSVGWSIGITDCGKQVPIKDAPKSAIDGVPSSKSSRLARFIRAD
ncbi:unnamed protein product [Periconia digitata]|uniref:Jacalin-type lectin domain-containing protein n=1 Tax=Periconia digitata TaxID=1303443 RepID=A0A9W4XPT6_9PLEO|nr:unnamed protein product [Periconia digitata]